MVAAVDGVKEDPAHEVIFSGHAVPGHMDMEGLAYATGVALRWWRDIYFVWKQQNLRQGLVDTFSSHSFQVRLHHIIMIMQEVAL